MLLGRFIALLSKSQKSIFQDLGKEIQKFYVGPNSIHIQNKIMYDQIGQAAWALGGLLVISPPHVII